MAFGTAETAKLVVDLSLTGNYQAGLTKAQRQFGALGKQITDTQGRAYKAGQQIGTGIKRGVFIAVAAIGTLGAALAFAVKQGQEAANVQKIFATAVSNSYKTAADQTKTLQDRISKFQKALASAKPGSKAAQNLTNEIKALKAQLGGIGAITPAYVAALNAQQKALENLAGVDDELIKSEQTRLIQMGLSGKATLALTPLILDAAKATGKDLLTVTIAAGKAANGNATALQRLGIQVDKTRFKVDPLAETIRVLNQRFGGTTKALSGSFDVRLAALRENLNDIAENAGQKLLPALTRIVDVVGTKVVPALGSMVDRLLPEVVKGINEFADALESGAAENAIRGITDALGPMVDLVKIAAAPVKAIVSAFLSLPKELQTVLIGAFAVNKLTGGLVTNVFGGIAEAIAKSFIRAPLVNVQGGVVNVGGAPGVGGAGGGALAGLFGPAVIATIAAVASKTIADLTNQEFANKGQTTNFVAPGSGIFGIDSAIHNLQEAFKLLTGGAKTANSALTDLEKNPVFHPGMGLPELPGRTHATGTEAGNVEAHRGAIIARIDRDSIAALARASKPATPKDKPATPQDIEMLRGKIADGLVQTGKQIDDIAPSINPKLLNLDRSVDTAGQVTAGAIRNKDLSIDQSIVIKVNVSAAGVTKSVTIQNRAGPGTGSAGDDFRGGKPAGGL